jgi:hypothetical protein
LKIRRWRKRWRRERKGRKGEKKDDGEERRTSWRPLKLGSEVLTSIMIFSADARISGVAPTEAPGTIEPSSRISVASTIAQSRGLVGSPCFLFSE